MKIINLLAIIFIASAIVHFAFTEIKKVKTIKPDESVMVSIDYYDFKKKQGYSIFCGNTSNNVKILECQNPVENNNVKKDSNLEIKILGGRK